MVCNSSYPVLNFQPCMVLPLAVPGKIKDGTDVEHTLYNLVTFHHQLDDFKNKDEKLPGNQMNFCQSLLGRLHFSDSKD